MPEPEFKYDLSGFVIEFKGRHVETSGKTSGKIVELIKSNPSITIPELSSIIGVSERSIERNIQKLHKENRLERIGPAKGGYWKLME